MGRHKFLTLFLFFAFVLFSCEKEEGPGGTSTIEGRVYLIDYNDEWTFKRGEYYAPGIDVYLIYGDDNIYSDDFKTGIDGWYRFEFLRPGDYKVYAFSRDSLKQSSSGIVPVLKTVHISGNNETVNVDDIVIFD